MEKELISLRIDDIPLIYEVVKELKIGKSIDDHVLLHGNWEGISVGTTVELWLCYILSEGDHRLSAVENWVESRLELLRAMSEVSDLSSYDFSDDKLGLILEYISLSDIWGMIESSITCCLLSIYRFGEEGIATFRLDAAPIQSYGQVKEGGLLQYGYHKHHPNLGQIKVKLCTLDNAVNHFSSPICHLTVEGNKSDDELYIPIIERNRKVLEGVTGYQGGNLYVGDKKFAALKSRGYVVSKEDYYMMPLSLNQLSKQARVTVISNQSENAYEKVFKEQKGTQLLVAQGFEEEIELSFMIDDITYSWLERRLYVHSIQYVKSQEKALEARLTKSISKIEALPVRKQGKRVLKSKEEYTLQIAKLLKDNKLEGLLDCEIKEIKTVKKIRAHKEKPAREEIEFSFEVSCTRKEEAIEAYKKTLGWQVYATNAPKSLMPFEKCVWKYRHQSNIESRFDDLRNKVAGLVPIFLQKEERIKGLVNILLLALKVCSNIEYQAAKSLKDNDKQLSNVYEGNPKRTTERPSSLRLFRAFKGLSISLIFVDKTLQFAIMSQMNNTQHEILELLGLNRDIYSKLMQKIEFLFFKQNLPET